jgi:hypothetical protein
MDGLVAQRIGYYLIAEYSDIWTLQDTAIVAGQLIQVARRPNWIMDIGLSLLKSVSKQLSKFESVEDFMYEHPQYYKYYFNSSRVFDLLQEFYPTQKISIAHARKKLDTLLSVHVHGIYILQRPIVIGQSKIFKTIAKRQFKLTDLDLKDLDYKVIHNPYYHFRYAYLYNAVDIRKVAREKPRKQKQRNPQKQKTRIVPLGSFEQQTLDQLFL